MLKMAFSFFPSFPSAFLLTDSMVEKLNYRSGREPTVYPHHIQKNTPASLFWAEKHILSPRPLCEPAPGLSRQPSKKGKFSPCTAPKLATRGRNPALGCARTFPERLRLFPASRDASAGLGVRPLGFGCIRAGLAAVVQATRGGAEAQPRRVAPARNPEQGVWGPGASGQGDDEGGPGMAREVEGRDGSGSLAGSRSLEPGAWRRATPRAAPALFLRPLGYLRPEIPAWAGSPERWRIRPRLGGAGRVT